LPNKPTGPLPRSPASWESARTRYIIWKKQLETHSSKAFPGKGREADDETARLKRELAAAKEEIEILKKAAAYFARELR
jgi:transposase-like protein